MRFLRFFLVVLLVFGAVRAYYRLTDDFRLSNISYPLPFQENLQIPPLAELERAQIINILSQNYSYLGKGAQSYAFRSQDGQYVLKFFKFKHLKPNVLEQYLPNISLYSSSLICLRFHQK